MGILILSWFKDEVCALYDNQVKCWQWDADADAVRLRAKDLKTE